MRQFLRVMGRIDTLRHVGRVTCAARPLARRFGIPLAQSDLACTAHDLAAVVPLREILSVAHALGVPLSDADRAIPQVVHGPVAEAVLRERLDVRDDDVLNAVRHHSTLRAGASPLELLVFIADKISPDPTARNLGFHPVLLDAQRRHASLPQLCLVYLDWAVRQGPRHGWRLHPNLVAAWEELRAAAKRASPPGP